jgi:hypothetical protein
MSQMTFSLDDFRLPYCLSDDERLQRLGNWITTDISIYKGVGLDALATLADVAAGRPVEPWDSENYAVEFSGDTVSIRNQWVEADHGEFSIAEVRGAVEDYWQFLVAIPDNPDLIREFRPDLPEWQAALLMWEQTWRRPHPYRGILF